MRLAKLRHFKFSDLNFYHYFFTAYIGLHVTFSVLLANITAFAPDEESYLDLFSKLYNSDFTLAGTPGFDDANLNWLKLIYLPAKLMNILGVESLLALRFLSIGYSAMATLLLVRIAKSTGRDDRYFRTGLILISFMPTVFLWSSIGLRENFLYLEMSTILFCLSRLRNNIDFRNTLLLGFALFSLAMTKNYIYILFLFATLITLTLFSFINRRNFVNHLLVLSLTLIPLAVNPTLIPAINNYLLGQVEKVDTIEIGDINNDGRCDSFEPCANGNGNGNGNSNSNEEDPVGYVATGGMTVHALLGELKRDPNTFVARIASAFGITSKLEAISKSAIVVETDKSVVENQKKLSLQQAGLKKPLQVLESSAKFLLVPFIFMDNGSLFLNIQSMETPIWLFIYGLFFVGLYHIIRRRHELDYAVMIATLFAFEFVAISALTEINVGTALRHRSLLLIPILVIWVARKKKPASL